MRLSKRSSMLALWFLAVPILATITEAQQGNGPEVQLQAAMQKELVEGDLDQAIELYRAIVDGHGSNRAVAARALLYLGRSYDKLGSHEAQRAYERLLSDYPEQEVASADRPRQHVGARLRRAWAWHPSREMRRTTRVGRRRPGPLARGV